MTATRKPLSFPWIGVAVLAVLIGGYVAAYYATVERALLTENYSDRIKEICPIYPSLNRRLVNPRTRFFTPIHWLDRRLRPHVWEPTL